MTKKALPDTSNKVTKWLAIYSAAAAALFFILMLIYSGFKFSAPLDDAFIYMQYAKNLAKGGFFEYVLGEGYSSGATSFLYAFLLAPFAVLLKGGALVIITYVIGGVCLFFSGYYIYKLTRLLVTEAKFAVFAAALFVTNGNILWGYFSGMEICIFSALIISSLYYLAFGAPMVKQLVPLCLLSIVRPEGFILVVMLVTIKAAARLFNKKEAFAPYLTALIPGAAYFFINYIFTGDFMPNTMRAKSDFSQYYFHVTEVLKQGAGKYLAYLRDVFNGRDEHYFPAYSLLLFVTGLFPGLVREVKRKKAGPFMTAFFWFFAGILSTVFSSFFTVHNYRYAMPFVVLFAPFLACGLSVLFGAGRKKVSGNVKYTVMSVFIIFNFFTITANAVNFGRDCRDIHNQSIQAGKWIKANLPASARVAINDVGAITYFSDAKVFDLVGLVTNNQARIFRNGKPAVYEEVERVKPDYFMIHLGWFNYEGYSFFGLSDRRIVDFHIKREPAYYVVGSPEVCVPPIEKYFGSGDRMVFDHSEGGRFAPVDRLDTADLRSEEKHNYSIWSKRPPNVPGTLLKEEISGPENIVVIDAGRITGGGEEFSVGPLKPGKKVKIVRRAHNQPVFSQEVFVNGKKAGTWTGERGKGFTENSYIIDGGMVKGGKITVSIEEKSPNRYNSFHYWALQEKGGVGNEPQKED